MSGTSHPASWSAVAPFLRRSAQAVRNHIVRRAVDKALMALDDRVLEDLAISRGEIRYLSCLAARALAQSDCAGEPRLDDCPHRDPVSRQYCAQDDVVLPLAA